jgi:phage shock protein PspC (stress-responsive transcriptional regulator)
MQERKKVKNKHKYLMAALYVFGDTPALFLVAIILWYLMPKRSKTSCQQGPV